MKWLLFHALLAMSLAGCADASSQQGESRQAQVAAPAAVSEVPLAAAAPVVAEAPVATDPAKEAEVDARIDKVLGDHAAYRGVLTRLQAAVAEDDRSGVAALVRYPLDVRTSIGKLSIDNAQSFIARYDDIVIPQVAQAITAQRYEDLFVSQNGVMLGAGQVWINGTCHDRACVDVDVKVTTFQQGG